MVQILVPLIKIEPACQIDDSSAEGQTFVFKSALNRSFVYAKKYVVI
jgi:hypothetical protein